MKKFLLIFLTVLFSLQLCANAADTNWTEKQNLERVTRIGQALLQKNGLPTKITFKVLETDDVNAYATGDKEIYVYTGLLKFVSNDEELAGVISHEMGHIINHHSAKQTVANAVTSTAIANINFNKLSPQFGTVLNNGVNVANNLTMLKLSRVEEYEADVTGVDLMTKAGYNPLAMVSFLFKLGGSYADFTSTHPSSDKRTMYIYDYISYTYPDKAKATYNTDSYKKFMLYAQPIVDKRNANPKKLNAFNKEQQKLQTKRLAKLEKYKTQSDSTAWDKSFNFIKSLSE